MAEFWNFATPLTSGDIAGMSYGVLAADAPTAMSMPPPAAAAAKPSAAPMGAAAPMQLATPLRVTGVDSVTGQVVLRPVAGPPKPASAPLEP